MVVSAAVKSQISSILYSPSDVASYLSCFGAPSECIQLENGPFKASINILPGDCITKITFKANKTCLITGDKPESKIQLSYGVFDNSGHSGLKTFSSTISKSTIAGFGERKEAHATIPAGLEVVYFSFPKSPFLRYANKYGFDSFLELTDRSNHIDLDWDDFLSIKKGLHSLARNHSKNNFTLFDLLSLLSPQQLPRKESIHNRHKIAHQFVRWCHSYIEGEPPCLDQIAKHLFVSKRTLILAVQEYFNQGPAELMKSMRLQRCHQGLLGGMRFPDQCIEPLAVSEVMQLYGFKHRGAFARSFKDYFGYAPSETADQVKLSQ